jgi:hypothetical protein
LVRRLQAHAALFPEEPQDVEKRRAGGHIELKAHLDTEI